MTPRKQDGDMTCFVSVVILFFKCEEVGHSNLPVGGILYLHETRGQPRRLENIASIANDIWGK